VIVAGEGATFHDVPHFGGGVVPGDGIFTAWSYRAGAGRAEAFLLNPRPLTAQTAHEWGVIAEVVPNGKALSRARELAKLYLKAPEVTRRNTRVHFIQPLKERIVREVGYRKYIGGSCPNIACLPSKNIIHSAKVASYFRRSKEFGITHDGFAIDMAGVRERKRRMVRGLNDMYLENYRNTGAEFILGTGRFLAPRTVEVTPGRWDR